MHIKRTLRERIAITARGYRLLGKYCPGLARDKALSALVTSLQPFITLWFSARIIGEISDGRSVVAVAAYAIATVTLGFAA